MKANLYLLAFFALFAAFSIADNNGILDNNFIGNELTGFAIDSSPKPPELSIVPITQFGTSYGVSDNQISTEGNNIYIAGSDKEKSSTFLIKYDLNGKELFKAESKSYELFKPNALNDLSVDRSGNSYLIGYTSTNDKGYEAKIVKFDSSGNKIWDKTFGGEPSTSDDRGYAITTDSKGDVIVTGSTKGTMEKDPVGGSDIFIAKFDTTGNKIWVKQFGTKKTDRSWSIVTDDNNNIYVTGTIQGGLDGGSYGGADDVFIAKFDTTGNKVWTKQFGDSSTDTARDIIIHNNDLYVVGYMEKQYLQGDDIFVAKYDLNGNQIWIKKFGTSKNSQDRGIGLVVDSNGYIYVAGDTLGVFEGQTSIGGTSDLFISIFNSDGNQLSLKQFGTSDLDRVSDTVLIDKTLYLTGQTYGVFEGIDLPKTPLTERTFLVKVQTSQQSNPKEIQLADGWNLVSKPFNSEIASCGDLVTYSFDSSAKKYSEKLKSSQMIPGTGYWIRSEGCSMTFSGTEEFSLDKIGKLSKGQNLIGIPTKDLDLSQAEGCVIESIHYWNAIKKTYEPQDNNAKLSAGKAYWIKVADECTFKAKIPASNVGTVIIKVPAGATVVYELDVSSLATGAAVYFNGSNNYPRITPSENGTFSSGGSRNGQINPTSTGNTTQTPLTSDDFVLGNYKLTVFMDGYQTASKKFSVSAGETTTVEIILEEIQIANLIITDIPQSTKNIYVKYEDSSWIVNAFWTSSNWINGKAKHSVQGTYKDIYKVSENSLKIPIIIDDKLKANPKIKVNRLYNIGNSEMSTTVLEMTIKQGDNEVSLAPAPHVCGNKIKEEEESCDDGTDNGKPLKCNAQCTGKTTPVCGNGVKETGEACDGNTFCWAGSRPGSKTCKSDCKGYDSSCIPS